MARTRGEKSATAASLRNQAAVGATKMQREPSDRLARVRRRRCLTAPAIQRCLCSYTAILYRHYSPEVIGPDRPGWTRLSASEIANDGPQRLGNLCSIR